MPDTRHRKTPKPGPAPQPAVLPVDTQAGGTAGTTEQRLYDAVFDSVMRRRLPPGTKLPESALCDLFGVGRTVVRRALQALAHDRIVDLRPNRGATVAMPTPQETREVFEARRGIEAAIVRLATARQTPTGLAMLRALLQTEHDRLHTADQPAWAWLASSFHLQLARLAGNATLERYLQETMSRCSLIVALYEPPGNARCEHAEHAAIVDCIARGDAEAATTMMVAHLHTLESHVCMQPDADAKGSLRRMLGLD